MAHCDQTGSGFCGSVRGSLTLVLTVKAAPKPPVVIGAVAARHGQESSGFPDRSLPFIGPSNHCVARHLEFEQKAVGTD